MKRFFLSLIFLPLLLFVASPAFAIGSFDISNIVVTQNHIQFNIANLDRTNDGDHGGYDGHVGFSSIYCYDTNQTVAYTQDGNKYDTGYNTGDLVSYTNTGYDDSLHTDCVARIYTNNGSNDYQSNQHFDIPTEASPAPTSTPEPTPTPTPSIPEDKNECKKGGWMDFVSFKNQGSCVSFVEKLKRLLNL